MTFIRKVTSRDIYLKAKSPRQFLRKVLPILIIVVGVSGFIGWKIYQINQQTKQVNTLLAPFEQQLQQAKDQLNTDPIQSRATVANVIKELKQLENNFAGQKKATQLVDKQLIAAKKLYDQISGQELWAARNFL